MGKRRTKHIIGDQRWITTTERRNTKTKNDVKTLFSGSERYTDSLRTRIIRSSPPTTAILVSDRYFQKYFTVKLHAKMVFLAILAFLLPSPSAIARNSPTQTGNWSIRSRTRTDRVRCRAKKNAVCTQHAPNDWYSYACTEFDNTVYRGLRQFLIFSIVDCNRLATQHLN